MDAYLPRESSSVAIFGALAGGMLLVGFVLRHWRAVRVARVLAWTSAIGAVVAVERASASEPPGFRMLAICGVLLYGMKAIVSVESRAADEPRPSALGWLAFALGWFGMRPGVFAARTPAGVGGSLNLALRGVAQLATGGVLYALARLILVAGASPWLAAVVVLPALSLILHFGTFNLLAALWRRAGYPAHPLFRAPLAACSLREFWGKRWNLAFSEMTSIAVYRPLVRRAGLTTAVMAAFLFSGLLHELAISVPVQRWYGGPLAYFALHGLLVVIEGALERRGRALHTRPRLGRAWTVFWLVLPLPVLFHPPFLEGVILPLLGVADPYVPI